MWIFLNDLESGWVDFPWGQCITLSWWKFLRGNVKVNTLLGAVYHRILITGPIECPISKWLWMVKAVSLLLQRGQWQDSNCHNRCDIHISEWVPWLYRTSCDHTTHRQVQVSFYSLQYEESPLSSKVYSDI
jgi:hypothetical protein